MRTVWVALALVGCVDGGQAGSETELADTDEPCGEMTLCPTASGEYFAFPPDDWDGESELPAVVHYHGWNGSPSQYYGDEDVLEAYDRAGVLVVMPLGAEDTWTVDDMGLEGSGRDEIAFTEEILEDMADRWPVDPTRTYVSGQSLGASMAYHAGCELGDRFAALAPSSGGFWEPMPESCPAPPLPVCHIHGVNDSTWPVEGREVSEGAQTGVQVPIEDDIAFWRTHNACGEATTEYADDVLTCVSYDDCEDGTEVNLCLHDGGHALPEGWTSQELEWMLQFTRE